VFGGFVQPMIGFCDARWHDPSSSAKPPGLHRMKTESLPTPLPRAPVLTKMILFEFAFLYLPS